MKFESLGLAPNILKAIAKKGYTKASPIQEKAIPQILKGRDVLASAQTGTGKTAGFTLPMLHILDERMQNGSRHKPKALIITPTRELAAQIYDNLIEYSVYTDIKSMVIFGGVNQKPQVRQLRSGVDILVATPGRLLDLHSQGVFSLKEIEFLVLDEADRMLDMGFLRDIRKILALLPEDRQNLLFSATFSKDIKTLANTFLTNPILVEADPENSTVEKIKQRVVRVDKNRKTALMIELIEDGDWQQVLVFTRTKHGANRLTKKMVSEGITAAAIHGNKSQGARTKALAGFKDGSVRVLVATDIAARGLDIPLLPHVVNFELPNIPEDYVHRIGRTGRAGADGEAISLLCAEETAYLRDIEKLLKERLPFTEIEGFETTEDFSKIQKPVRKQQQGRRGGGQQGARKAKRPNNRFGKR
jgi:ATP-dependent RNA helicase RhlE